MVRLSATSIEFEKINRKRSRGAARLRFENKLLASHNAQHRAAKTIPELALRIIGILFPHVSCWPLLCSVRVVIIV